MSVTAIAANQLDNLAAEVAPPLRDKLRAIAATLRTVPNPDPLIHQMHAALDSCYEGDYTTSIVIHPSLNANAVREACAAAHAWFTS